MCARFLWRLARVLPGRPPASPSLLVLGWWVGFPARRGSTPLRSAVHRSPCLPLIVGLISLHSEVPQYVRRSLQLAPRGIVGALLWFFLRLGSLDMSGALPHMHCVWVPPHSTLARNPGAPGTLSRVFVGCLPHQTLARKLGAPGIHLRALVRCLAAPSAPDHSASVDPSMRARDPENVRAHASIGGLQPCAGASGSVLIIYLLLAANYDWPPG